METPEIHVTSPMWSLKNIMAGNQEAKMTALRGQCMKLRRLDMMCVDNLDHEAVVSNCDCVSEFMVSHVDGDWEIVVNSYLIRE